MVERITVDELRKRFGDVKVSFSRYYKYSFTFEEKNNEKGVTIIVGGDHNDIYRFEVNADELPLSDLLPMFYSPIIQEGENGILIYESF